MKRTKRRAWRVLAIFASVIGLIRLAVDLVSVSQVMHLPLHLSAIRGWMSHNIPTVVELIVILNFSTVMLAIWIERRRNDKRYVKSRAAAARRQRKQIARNGLPVLEVKTRTASLAD
jgi:formate-dependent nitrite reductase membrane component NrfD